MVSMRAFVFLTLLGLTFSISGPNRVYYITADEGSISTPDWSLAYPPYAKLRWVISSQSSRGLELQFDKKFGIQPGFYAACLDHVTVYDASVFDLQQPRCAYNMHQPIGRFCGYERPRENFTVSENVVVEFCSLPGNVSAKNVGFKLSWSTTQDDKTTVEPITLPPPLDNYCGHGNPSAVPKVQLDEYDEISDYGQTVGAEEALANSWPWVAAIFTEQSSFRCMASLVSLDLLLTSASCLDWKQVLYAKLGAQSLGSTFEENETTQIVCQVVGMVKHPRYLQLIHDQPEVAKNWDIALLRISCSRSLVMDYPHISTVCLPSEDSAKVDHRYAVMVLGWGANDTSAGDKSDSLKQVVVFNKADGSVCLNPYLDKPYKNADCIEPYQGGNYYQALTIGSPMVVRSEGRWSLRAIFTGEAYPGPGMATMFLKTQPFARWISETAAELRHFESTPLVSGK